MAHGLHRVGVVSAGTHVRRGHALVGVGSLLDNDLLVAALARAAAHADEPEETAANGKGNADPEDGKHACGPRRFNVVRVEHGAEDRDEGAVEGGGGRGRGDDEESLRLRNCVSTIHGDILIAGKLTVEMMVVIRLPHLLKMAEMPTRTSAMVNTRASM